MVMDPNPTRRRLPSNRRRTTLWRTRDLTSTHISPQWTGKQQLPLIASWTFGSQEEKHFQSVELDAFLSDAVLEGAYLYTNHRPGPASTSTKTVQLLAAEARHGWFCLAGDWNAAGAIVRL